MPFAIWTDTMSVGIERIDAQHRQLLDAINDLHEAVGAGKGREVREALFQVLAEYVGTHFSTEEELMRRHQYPDIDSHKRAHEGFTAKVRLFRQEAAEGDVSDEVLTFLKGWLVNHDILIDRKLGAYLNARGER